MRSRRGWRASWLHVPGGSHWRAGGVVVCPPLGHEYTHSYRTLLRLADGLAEAGIVALRFDYRATGSSSGDPLEHRLVDAWVEDIRVAAELVRDLTGGPVSLIGLRIGAALAGIATSQCEIEHMVAWAPVLSGRRYLREHRALAEVGGEPPASNEGVQEAGGFVVSSETATDLASVDLAEHGCPVRGQALVVERDDLPAGSRLPERLRQDGITTDVMTSSGYLAMMAKPHLTVIPTDTIAAIVGWFEARAPSRPRQALRLPPETSALSFHGGVPTTIEELVHVPGPSPLFGVLTRPVVAPPADRPALILINGGSAHSVGPNRLYVDISRRLAGSGYPTLRLDLRNLGDSIRGHAAEENHPYPTTALADVARAVEWLTEERDVQRVVLGGLCAGAYHAFRCGIKLPHSAIEGLLLMNPLTFHWSKDSVLIDAGEAAPHAPIRDSRKWRRLIAGQYDLPSVFHFAGSAARARAGAAARHALDRLGLLKARPLDRELEHLISRGRRVDFFYSRNDPGYGLLRASTSRVLDRMLKSGALSLTLIEGADHSFSRRASREELLGGVDECVRRYGSADLSRAENCRSSMDRALATASS